MQRQLSNVSFYSYQDYQPSRKHGPQYEPGGYAAAVQQRTNMTQREDALKFEQGRIKALQEERLHIQKKTFTKWMNSFLQKARMEVEDLFVDLADGRRLLKLLEIISGERLPRPNSGRMRVHKIENVNKSLSFLHTKVRLESIGAEDIVDGNPRLILGLIWTIILRFQIQEIEIDVDEENESSEKKSAKDALLLWCQRKTSGYHGVHIHNFSDSWRSGLGFNALIHAHRPDLFRWTEVPTHDHVETLNHAFDVAHQHLGIPKLLDAEDVDTTRPDEKSVMTYVASYYHTFARMKNEQKSGRRIANIIAQLMDIDARKAEYSRLVSALLEWIRRKIEELNGREFPNSLDAIQRLLLAFKQYRTVEKPPKYKERSEIEALYFDINTMHKSLVGEPWSPLEGQLPQDLERAWQQLEQAEHARELALRTELLRQQRLEQLNYKFTTKSVLRKGYLKEMIQVLSDPRYGSNLAQVDATVKKHEAISADILARKERFEDLSAMAAELVRSGYHGAENVSRCCEDVLQRWEALLQLLEGHRTALARLANLAALLRETDAAYHTLREMKAQFHSEEVGRHLSDVERLLQAHALQELQLGALDESIRKLVRQGKAVEGPAQPKQQLAQQLTHLEDEYDSLVAAAKDRKARLEDARNLYQFLEDHDEEEGWVRDKQRVCRADIAAKDLRGVQALRVKHTALLHEMRAKDHVAQRHRVKGQSLIEEKHPKSAEIERRLSTLNKEWEVLRELAAAREKQLADAAELYQFYEDANEADSWMKEKRPLVSSSDVGRDAPAAAALLARTRALHEQIAAYRADLAALQDHAEALKAQGIHSLQLPTEVESGSGLEEEEWVNETRLVPTDVWEEEPVERLEHRTVTEERAVPQVKALYAFTGQGISMAKGEVMFLISKTNPDWWSVRKADRTDGFVPANYVREIEPRIVPVQVRRPEKVRSVQRVKKTVLVKQVVPVRRPAPRRARPARHAPAPPAVADRLANIQEQYDELLKLSAERRLQLEDAIKLFNLFAECDDLEKWCKEKEKMLNADDSGDTVDSAKRKYEQFVTDLSAASKRLEQVEASVEQLVAARHPQASRAQARRTQLRRLWDRLLHLKRTKEKSLEGANSVEVFERACEEALEWMREKNAQLEGAGTAGGADLRSARALQRRHAQLERELQPLRDRVRTVHLLADDVGAQHPSERGNVALRAAEVAEAWEKCEKAAAARRANLQAAVGRQALAHSAAQLGDWAKKIREQLAQEETAKDVATAEACYKQHQELKDDIKAHDDEFKEVIELGQKLLADNPSLTDVADKVKELEEVQKAVYREWDAKEDQLKQAVQLATFNREADRIDAATGAHQRYLEYQDTGNSVSSAEALLKRHEELEARLAAHDERLPPFVARATQLRTAGHHASAHIESRKNAVLARRDEVRQAAAERRRALQASLAYQQFVAATEELQSWIQDKTKTAKDQSYRDLANLERKLQKHEAFERELQANEKQLRNVESVGQSLQKSDPGRATEVQVILQKLQTAWEELVAASRDKGSKLRQAHAQRAHKRNIEDAKARLVDLERALTIEETGSDLRSCKRLLNQHQTVEQELSLWEQKAKTLAASGQDLVSDGHFDAPAIEKSSAALLDAAKALREPIADRRKKLETSLQVHKFAAEVAGELDWLEERKAAASSETVPAELHAAQQAAKRHAKLTAELDARKVIADRLLARGQALVDEKHPDSDKIIALSESLRSAQREISAAAAKRAARLERGARAAQFAHEAREVRSWLADARAHLATPYLGDDRHRATMLLTRHKAVELELDTYAAIISEMGHTAAAAPEPEGTALRELHQELAAEISQLQDLAAERRKALVGSVCRHEYLAESAELEEWIQEQYAAASSEDYGQDYEHLLILRSKFDELRHRVESGAERFAQCEELAHKLISTDSPHIQEIEERQEALSGAWQKLVEQLKGRAARLIAAGDIHRFHRDVGELLARAADKQAALLQPLPATASAHHHTDHDADLLALDAQLQVLQEEGARLSQLYPGSNVQQIERRRKALADAATALRAAAASRRRSLAAAAKLQAFRAQVRDLSGWASALRNSMSGEAKARDASAAQAMRADHDAVKAEIEARDDSFRQAIQLADEMVQAGHPAAQELEERSEALLAERGKLHAAWAARQVGLDQLIDLHCFLRDAAQLMDLCAAQEKALGTEISPTLSVEEVDNQLKKHEAFEKLLVTQDEKLATLNSHGDKLLQQNHVESQRIADELKLVNERRKKIHDLASLRRSRLARARARAQFARDVAEARAWLHDKAHAVNADQHGEATNLEDKIKKLQKHQAFRAELAANSARIKEVEALAEQLKPDAEVESAIVALKDDWQKLLLATEQRGRGLEEAQDMLEFNQHLDKIETWIRDKEMMVQAHELGRDYEHCASLMRKLDDLDSDMKVDDRNLKTIEHLADKLMAKGSSASTANVASRRDACVSKWRALTGALQKYREALTAALDLHAFNRDVQDTEERIAKKSTLFSSEERGRSLSGARDLRRRHQALLSEAQAVHEKIAELDNRGKELAKSYPERAKEIDTSLRGLQEGWKRLQELAVKRSALLDDALAAHNLDENIKELDLWVSETVKRMDSGEPVDSIAAAEAALETHHETKAEIDGRQKSIATLQKQAETELAGKKELPEKQQRLSQLSKTLDDAWQKRKLYLTQAHELQLLKEQARQVEDWLAAKEAFLNNDDLGENLDAVEALQRKHVEFAALLGQQQGKLRELEQLAARMLDQGHGEAGYVRATLNDVQARAQRLQDSCAERGKRLEQSRQLQQFLRDLRLEREWIQVKMQQATDTNYRDLSNLQSKIQKQTAFESELATNKGRIDDVANHGEELIEAKHYASQDIAEYVEDLENQWRELQEAAKLRRERLQEAYQARVYLRGLDDFCMWLDDVDAQLLSEDHGKDLSSVKALLKRHARLEQQVSSKGDVATQLADDARHLAQAGHFMADEITEKADDAVKRYRQLQEPMQIRRANLEDAELLYRWERDADEELKWLQEKEPALNSDKFGSNVAEAQALLKKQLALEAEIMGREPTVSTLANRAAELSRRGHYAAPALEGGARSLQLTWRDAAERAAARTKALTLAVETLQLLSEVSETESWLRTRRAALSSPEVGRDEESVLVLQKKLQDHIRELANFDATLNGYEVKVNQLTAQAQDRTTSELTQVKTKLEQLKAIYEEMKLLSAKRERRLQQSLKYFKFAQECAEAQEWVGEQMSAAASEEYGLDAEHVDALQQSFNSFLQQLHANEGRIEGVVEAGNALLEENTPEAEMVKQRIEDIRGLWEDLKELALARQEALAGARQVHEFDRSADETAAWISAKEALLEGAGGGAGEAGAPRDVLHARSRRLHALLADLDAIRAAHTDLSARADKLGEAYPDAKEHVVCKLEEVTEALEALTQRVTATDQQLQHASQLHDYFGTYQDLLAWTNEMIARVTAPGLGEDVAAAERLQARHSDIGVEMRAKDDAFKQLYDEGEKLIREGHLMSSEIKERMEALRRRKELLETTWTRREELYAQHLDALVFKRDADALDAWMNTRVPLVRDGKLGESVSQVEELINRHRDLEETIEAQKERFDALKRITLVEQAFQQQQKEEVAEKARAEAARREETRRQHVQRLADQRRRDHQEKIEESTISLQPERELRESTQSLASESQETLSPAPQFDKLPKHDAGVKRAESMQVSTKTPKRTPSFTTRRRTQSFRRHRLPDNSKPPPVEIEGPLERKQVAGSGGVRAAVRSWRAFHVVLCGHALAFFRDRDDYYSDTRAAAPPIPIANARCEQAHDYTKRAHVFRLSCADGAEYLFSASSRDALGEWVAKLSFHAKLPPQLQLTPYEATAPGSQAPGKPDDDLRRRLENASSSSSARSSPEVQRRSQKDILQQHRASQASQQAPPLPDRNIESTVLPSLPPRKMDIQEDPTEVVLRNSEQPSWGRSRFSNGRDMNAEFIKSQREAYGAPPLPSSEPPNLPERAPNLPERGPNLPERGTDKQMVQSMVNSYQQRMSRNWDNNNPQNRGTSWNHNWQNVETTSHFYSASEIAYGSGSGVRPASVAGSGGSPALDQRPASRSSGESELSLGGNTKEKKDKKGVFGGLFSRKKRPQSHM